jgi:hypothetical protein
MWREEHLWNVSVLQRLHLSNLFIVIIIVITTVKSQQKQEFAGPKVQVYKCPKSSENERQFLEVPANQICCFFFKYTNMIIQFMHEHLRLQLQFSFNYCNVKYQS